ncbi:hypothetical protein EIP86_010449 [Pleurotus ostreatoroseus]|nr:hypothetical protein EIP86_010449 [Pleurotus ostreatoroseus]
MRRNTRRSFLPLDAAQPERETASSEAVSFSDAEEGRRAEFKTLQKELETCKGEREVLRKDYEKIRKDYEKLRVDWEAWRREREVAQKERSSLKADVDRGREESKRFGEVQQAYDAAKHTIEENTREIAALKAMLAGQEKLLKTRSAELRQAQAYHSVADVISHADVVGMVERLNSNVFQLAASIVDSFRYDNPALGSFELPVHLPGAERTVGRGMIEFLTLMRRDADPAYVQMALQAALLNLASYFATSWDVRFDGDKNCLFTEIYMAIFQNEPAPVGGKWRSLAQQYTRRLGGEPNLTQIIGREMVDRARDILLVSGCSANVDHVANILEGKFTEKIRDIIADSINLQKAIGQDVLFSDLQIICPFYDEIFKPEEMEDADDKGHHGKRRAMSRAPKHARVLCASTLGLRKCEKRAVRDDPQREEVVTAIVLKAEVMLTSFAEDLVREPKSKGDEMMQD